VASAATAAPRTAKTGQTKYNSEMTCERKLQQFRYYRAVEPDSLIAVFRPFCHVYQIQLRDDLRMNTATIPFVYRAVEVNPLTRREGGNPMCIGGAAPPPG